MTRDSQHDGKSESKTVSNSMCDQLLVGKFEQFEERAGSCQESRIEGHCAHKVLNVLKKGQDLREPNVQAHVNICPRCHSSTQEGAVKVSRT